MNNGMNSISIQFPLIFCCCCSCLNGFVNEIFGKFLSIYETLPSIVVE